MQFYRDFWLKCYNCESEGTPREVLSLAICKAMSVNKDKKRTKTTSKVLVVMDMNIFKSKLRTFLFKQTYDLS